MRTVLALVLVGLAAFVAIAGPAAPVNGQFIYRLPSSGSASNPISAARLPGGSATLPNPVWAAAGVEGGIPTNRTQCVNAACATVTTNGSSATLAQINSAISGAPSNTYVLLGAGTFTLSGSIVIARSDVTLRGSGADQTRLIISGASSGCGFGTTSFAIRACTGLNIGTTAGGFSGPRNSATWSSGYVQGSTQIVISSTTNLAVGSTIWLDQLNDSADGYPAAGDLWPCEEQAGCSADGSSSVQRVDRIQSEAHKVTNINGTTITIDPGILSPNYRSGQTPGAWWGNVSGTIDVTSGVGLENFLLQFTDSSNIAGIGFINKTNSWIKGVSVIRTGTTASFLSHVYIVNGFRNTYEQNYFYGAESAGASNITNYAMAMYSGSQQLVQNNIFHHTTEPIEMAASEIGTVFGYNFENDSWFSSAGIQNHGFGMYSLSEGNNWGVRYCDNNHGPAFFETMFRDHYARNNGNGSTDAGAAMLTHCRFFNIVGNVFASTGWTTYQATDLANNSAAVYVTGWNGNCSNCGSMSTDTNVRRTLLRWGNWDNVTSTGDSTDGDATGTRFVSSEVPSGITNYANTVPASQTLPNSLYLSAKPAFLGSLPWPLIGPDVTGSQTGTHGITAAGGHAYKNAAWVCFTNATNDANYGSSSPRIKTGVASACATP